MKKLTLLLFAALALTAAGCGGGDDGGLTGGDVSKDAYVEQVDEICQDTDEAIGKASESVPEDPSDDEVQAFVEDTIVPEVQDEFDQIRELEAPEKDVERLEKIYDKAQEELDAVSDDPGAFVSEEAENPFEESEEMIADYGTAECWF